MIPITWIVGAVSAALIGTTGFVAGAKYANNKWEIKDAKRIQAQATADHMRREKVYDADGRSYDLKRNAVASVRTGDGVRSILDAIERDASTTCISKADGERGNGRVEADQRANAARAIETARDETEKLAVACAAALVEADDVWNTVRKLKLEN